MTHFPSSSSGNNSSGNNQPPKINKQILSSREEMARRFELVDWAKLDQEDRDDFRWALEKSFADNATPTIEDLRADVCQLPQVMRCDFDTRQGENGMLVYIRTAQGKKRFFTSPTRIKKVLFSAVVPTPSPPLAYAATSA